MLNQLTLRGMPKRLREDAWWMISEAPMPRPEPTSQSAFYRTLRKQPRLRPDRIALVIALVLLFDTLFLETPLGISVALFNFALAAALLVSRDKPVQPRRWAAGLGIVLISNLPVIEHVQLLSLLFSIGGMIVLVAWIAFDKFVSAWRALLLTLQLTAISPVLLPMQILGAFARARRDQQMSTHLAAFVLPLGVGALFVMLLSAANPIFSAVLNSLLSINFLTFSQVERIAIWGVVALFLWPFLNVPAVFRRLPNPKPQPPIALERSAGVIITYRSVRLSFTLFNLIFAFQTVTDLSIFFGGVSLPDGMTYAEYAHRGAYPLVATALLAGVFAVATQHQAVAHPWLRILMFLWLGQTLFLVLTAGLRLSSYVDVYNLTYLRIVAAIWMGLVFFGLCLTAIQIGQRRSIKWLLRSNSISLAVTLFMCCFVNFAHLIASYNLREDADPFRIDQAYICLLGEAALPAIHAYQARTGIDICAPYPFQPEYAKIEHWQEWGFRRWRLGMYLAQQAQE
ncbi:MAG: DUF4173 domain-containing protein [Pseudomonadota bacterium]